jgi:hypothetical protein
MCTDAAYLYEYGTYYVEKLFLKKFHAVFNLCACNFVSEYVTDTVSWNWNAEFRIRILPSNFIKKLKICF